MKKMSYNVSRAHNVNTYDYVKNQAAVLRDIIGREEFNRGEYEKKTSFWNKDRFRFSHRGLGFGAARKWGFIEVVRQEPRFMKEESVMVTSSGKRVCSAEEYRKMDETVIATIKSTWGELECKKMLSTKGDQYLNIYRWNDENYRKWLDEGRDMINERIRHEIEELMKRIATLNSEMI